MGRLAVILLALFVSHSAATNVTFTNNNGSLEIIASSIAMSFSHPGQNGTSSGPMVSLKNGTIVISSPKIAFDTDSLTWKEQPLLPPN